MLDESYFGKYTVSIVLILCLIFVMVVGGVEYGLIFTPLIIVILHNCIVNDTMETGNLDEFEEETDDEYDDEDEPEDKLIESFEKDKPEYDNSELIDAMFDDITNPPEYADGDYNLHRKMQDVQKNSERSAYIRTRFNAKNFESNFIEEMDDNERARWWENDDLQALMIKDGVAY